VGDVSDADDADRPVTPASVHDSQSKIAVRDRSHSESADNRRATNVSATRPIVGPMAPLINARSTLRPIGRAYESGCPAPQGQNNIAQGKTRRVLRAATPPWVRHPQFPRPSNPHRHRADMTEAEIRPGRRRVPTTTPTVPRSSKSRPTKRPNSIASRSQMLATPCPAGAKQHSPGQVGVSVTSHDAALGNVPHDFPGRAIRAATLPA
jgi:hypothetical protein